MKRIWRITPQNCIFFECDIQQKLSKHILMSHSMAHNAKRLSQLSKVLDIPVVATRHVKENFGDIE